MKDISKCDKIDTIRMKDIVAQLADIIYLLCDAKEADCAIIIRQLTNLTTDEIESLHIIFSGDINSTTSIKQGQLLVLRIYSANDCS